MSDFFIDLLFGLFTVVVCWAFFLYIYYLAMQHCDKVENEMWDEKQKKENKYKKISKLSVNQLNKLKKENKELQKTVRNNEKLMYKQGHNVWGLLNEQEELERVNDMYIKKLRKLEKYV